MNRSLQSRRNQSSQQHGFFTIWMLGLVVMLFGFGGLSVDLWRGFTERRELAAIADSAAIAGASRIDLNAFKDTMGAPVGSTPQIDQGPAIDQANAYIDQAIANAGITLSNRQVTVVGNQVQVQLSEKVGLTLSVLIAPGQKPFSISVGSSAEPRVAQ